MSHKPYQDTRVPVSRSQEEIRKLLIKFGVRGIQFAEDFETGLINLRFAKMDNGSMRTVNVIIKVREGKDREQMTRATYRSLLNWMKAQLVATEDGLFTFEDIFLSHFEWLLKDGTVTTVGEFIKPRLTSSQMQITAHGEVKA